MRIAVSTTFGEKQHNPFTGWQDTIAGLRRKRALVRARDNLRKTIVRTKEEPGKGYVENQKQKNIRQYLYPKYNGQIVGTSARRENYQGNDRRAKKSK